MQSRQQGFTLVELIVVIVILGILAATALPRFINVTNEARTAAVNGMAGGVRSAVSLAQARYMATGDLTSTAISMTGANSVTVNAGTGIPVGTAAGIGAALQATDGFDVVYANPVTFQPTNGGKATCGLTYNGTSGAVVVDASGC